MEAEAKGISARELKKDVEAFDALTAIADYKPAQEKYSAENISTLYDTMKSAQREEVRKQGEVKAARDNAAAAAYAFHEAMIQAKHQVRAQFGENSNELQSLGLKKKSERKSPVRKPKSNA